MNTDPFLSEVYWHPGVQGWEVGWEMDILTNVTVLFLPSLQTQYEDGHRTLPGNEDVALVKDHYQTFCLLVSLLGLRKYVGIPLHGLYEKILGILALGKCHICLTRIIVLIYIYVKQIISKKLGTGTSKYQRLFIHP